MCPVRRRLPLASRDALQTVLLALASAFAITQNTGEKSATEPPGHVNAYSQAVTATSGCYAISIGGFREHDRGWLAMYGTLLATPLPAQGA
jgi:hypothetical protein